MVESLKELNKICQKPRYKEVGNWMVRHFTRDAALPITWLLLHTSVTADQITLLSLIIAIGGALCMGLSGAPMFFLGAILLQAWYLLDHVDGQIARYRHTACMTGRFFDYIAHHIVHGIIPFSLGFYCYRLYPSPLVLVGGFTASVSIIVFNLLQDAKYKTFFEFFAQAKKTVVMDAADCHDEPKQNNNPNPRLKKLFSWCHKLCEIHVLMNALTACSIMQYFIFKDFDGRIFLFTVYGTVMPFIALVKLIHIIRTRQIDREFESYFEKKPS